MPDCLRCGASDARSRCARCKAARYCGAECQRAHWREHKPACRPAAAGAGPAKAPEPARAQGNAALELRGRVGRAQALLSGTLQPERAGEAGANVEEALHLLQGASAGLGGEHGAYASYLEGTARLQRARGDVGENQDAAMGCFRAALAGWPRQTAPSDWALAATSLASLLLERVNGSRGDNVEAALRLLQDVRAIHEADGKPVPAAHAGLLLADAFRQRAQGDAEANIERAIEHYEAALAAVREHVAGDPREAKYAAAMLGLADAYRERRAGEREANLARSEELHRGALRIWRRASAPVHWARATCSLAALLSEAAAGRADEAVALFREALPVLKDEPGAPAELWADGAVNAAVALAELRTREAAREARDLYEGALRVWPAASESAAIARVNLGSLLATGALAEPPAAAAEAAIAHYTAALRVLTREAFPQHWATATANLAAAYGERAAGARGDNLTAAVQLQKHALAFYAAEPGFELEHARDTARLGDLHLRMAAAGTRDLEQLRAPALAAARAAFSVASDGLDREAEPDFWAMAQSGLARCMLLGGDVGEVERASLLLRDALAVHTLQRWPWRHARDLCAVADCMLLAGNSEGATETIEHVLAVVQNSLATGPFDGAQTMADVQRSLAALVEAAGMGHGAVAVGELEEALS